MPGTVATGSLTVTLPSLPVVPSCDTPPTEIVTVLPATGTPAIVSLVMKLTLSPIAALVGGETNASIVAAGVAAASP